MKINSNQEKLRERKQSYEKQFEPILGFVRKRFERENLDCDTES